MLHLFAEIIFCFLRCFLVYILVYIFMKKLDCVCKLREFGQQIRDFERQLLKDYGVSLNEMVVLYSIGSERVVIKELSLRTGISIYNVSKIIHSAESKNLLRCLVGKDDKRQKFLLLTDKAKKCLTNFENSGMEIPNSLVKLLENDNVRS